MLDCLDHNCYRLESFLAGMAQWHNTRLEQEVPGSTPGSYKTPLKSPFHSIQNACNIFIGNSIINGLIMD